MCQDLRSSKGRLSKYQNLNMVVSRESGHWARLALNLHINKRHNSHVVIAVLKDFELVLLGHQYLSCTPAAYRSDVLALVSAA